MNSKVKELLQEKTDEINSAVESLSESQQNLLVDEVLYKITLLANGVREALSRGDLNDAAASLAILDSASRFAGRANRIVAERHEDWTAQSDRKVTEVLTRWADLIQDSASLALGALGLPEDVVARVKAGEATEADIRLIQEKASGEEGIEVLTDQEPAAAPSASVQKDSSGFGFGQYL